MTAHSIAPTAPPMPDFEVILFFVFIGMMIAIVLIDKD